MASKMNSRKQQRYSQEYFEDLLRSAGYKITPARLSVLGVLSGAKRPLSAQDIFQELSVSRENIQINYVTVYRSLNAFESDSLVKRIPIERDSNCYKLADAKEQYFVCKNCGDVYPFRSSISEQIAKDIEKIGGVAGHYNIQVYGLCVNCKKT